MDQFSSIQFSASSILNHYTNNHQVPTSIRDPSNVDGCSLDYRRYLHPSQVFLRCWKDPLTDSLPCFSTPKSFSHGGGIISGNLENPDTLQRLHDFSSLTKNRNKRTFSCSSQTVRMPFPNQQAPDSREAVCQGDSHSDIPRPSSGFLQLDASRQSRSAPVSVDSDSNGVLESPVLQGRKRRAKDLHHICAWKDHFRSHNENLGSLSKRVNYDSYRLLLQQKGVIQFQGSSSTVLSDECRRKVEEDATLRLCERRLLEYLDRSLSLAKTRTGRTTLRLHERLKAQEVLNSLDQTKVITERFNIEITQRIISCLAPMEWLNDEVINFYMSLLQERNDRHIAKQEPVPKTYFWNTFFFTKLTGEDESGTQQCYSFKNVSRWTKRKKVDLFSYDLILVPVHIRKVHWTLGAADLKSRRIYFFDSMNGSTGTEFYVNIMQYLKDEYLEKKGAVLPDEDEWIFDESETHPHVPQQSNGSDCGIFVCQFCECLSDGRPLDFTQDDIPNMRIKMIYQIIEGEIR